MKPVVCFRPVSGTHRVPLDHFRFLVMPPASREGSRRRSRSRARAETPQRWKPSPSPEAAIAAGPRGRTEAKVAGAKLPGALAKAKAIVAVRTPVFVPEWLREIGAAAHLSGQTLEFLVSEPKDGGIGVERWEDIAFAVTEEKGLGETPTPLQEHHRSGAPTRPPEDHVGRVARQVGGPEEGETDRRASH